MKTKTINKTITKSGQAVSYLEHLDVDGHKVRIQIKSDAYTFQSYARLEVLDAVSLKWSVVVFRPAEAMATETGLAYLPVCQRANADVSVLNVKFIADRLWLLDTFDQLVEA